MNVPLAVLSLALSLVPAYAQNDTDRYYKVFNDTVVSAECEPLAAYMQVSAGCSSGSTYRRVEGDRHIELVCDRNDPSLALWDDYDGSRRGRVDWSCPAAPPGVSVDRVDRVTKVVRITGSLTSCGRTDTVLTAQIECTYPGLRLSPSSGNDRAEVETLARVSLARAERDTVLHNARGSDSSH